MTSPSKTGKYEGSITEYVKNIGYDEYSQRIYIQYGNGTETNYTYDAKRRWLSNIVTNGADGVCQNMDYEFDDVGNARLANNSLPWMPKKTNNILSLVYQMSLDYWLVAASWMRSLRHTLFTVPVVEMYHFPQNLLFLWSCE